MSRSRVTPELEIDGYKIGRIEFAPSTATGNVTPGPAGYATYPPDFEIGPRVSSSSLLERLQRLEDRIAAIEANLAKLNQEDLFLEALLKALDELFRGPVQLVDSKEEPKATGGPKTAPSASKAKRRETRR